MGSRHQIADCVKEFLEVTKKPFKNINQQDVLNFSQYLETRPLKRSHDSPLRLSLFVYKTLKPNEIEALECEETNLKEAGHKNPSAPGKYKPAELEERCEISSVK